jgi:hypothetical protein
VNLGLHPGDFIFELRQVVVQALHFLGRRHKTPPTSAPAATVMAHAVEATTAVAMTPTMAMSVSVTAAMALTWHITHKVYLLFRLVHFSLS